MLAVEENLQPANMSYRTQGAAEQHPIKPRKCSSDAAVGPLQKTLHDSPPAFCLLAQTYNAKSESWSVLYFGYGVSRAA